MKMKHILMVGAIALVIVGCVLAAGCTSTSTNNGTNPASGLIFVGPSGGNSDEVKEILGDVQARYELDEANYDSRIRELNPSPASGFSHHLITYTPVQIEKGLSKIIRDLDSHEEK